MLPAADVCPVVGSVADMPVVAGSVAAGAVCSEAVVSLPLLAPLEQAVTDSAKPATKVQTLKPRLRLIMTISIESDDQ
jgi:hypothetical protein